MNRKLVITSVFVFIIFSIGIWSFYFKRIAMYKESFSETIISQSNNDLREANTQLQNLYETSKKTVLYLCDLVEQDFKEYNSIIEAKKNFIFFLKNDKNYFQARVIDESGKELIKTENINNNILSYEKEHLQNKANRYYFQEAIKLKKGQVYISDLDLNVENNEIEQPYRPTIRFFTSFFDQNNNPKGIVGLNLSASSWLNKISPKKIGILNSKNEVFYSADKNETLYKLSEKDLTKKDEYGIPIYISKEISLGGFNNWTIYTTLKTAVIKEKIEDYNSSVFFMALFLNVGLLFFLYIISRLYYKNKRISLLNTSINTRLEERNTLLKEIHHRVKNNLQVVTSLLNLQSRYINDPDVKSMLRYSQYRIQSMALLHETLYKSEDLSKINYSNYLNQLVGGLIVSMKGSNNQIELKLDIDDVFFNIDTSIPLGLVINEIVTNSLKYAFEDDKGIISIELKKLKNDNYLLKIGDNGKGIPKSISFRTTSTLGLKLVHKLVLQLQGNIEKDNTKPGTNYIIMFEEIQELS
jgi:two-component sensor histidine kinase